MWLLDVLRYRWRVFTRSRAHEQELAEELEFHVGLEAMQREQTGHGAISPGEARDAARRRLGNATYYKEEARRVSGLAFLDAVQQDVRFALRSFRRTPMFTAAAVLTLAAGIGANTAIFSVVNALLLRPLPFRQPDRLVSLTLTLPPRGSNPAQDGIPWSYPKFVVFRNAQNVFSDVTFWMATQFTMRVSDEAVRVKGEFVDSHYLPTLGVGPVIGRNFLAEEDRPGAPRTVILGDELWQRLFNADPGAIGRTIDIDGTPFSIIGVTPPAFRGATGDVAFWIPAVNAPGSWGSDVVNNPRNHSFFAVGRLAPGVSLERAQSIVHELGARVDATYPEPFVPPAHMGATVRPLDATRAGNGARRTLLVLFGAVGLVLLIACANVANLVLIRASGRRREIAVRLAIGAGRGRLVRQLLTESVLLSILGGTASLAVALAGVSVLSTSELAGVLRFQNAGLGTGNLSTIRLDLTALAFTGALAIVTGLFFGLMPALQATRPSLTETLKEEGTPLVHRLRAFTSRNVLTVIEITLAIVLLAGSGLMLRSLSRLVGVDPGFDAAHVLTMRVNRAPSWSRDSIAKFYDVAIDRLSAVPGVLEVAISDCPPLSGGCISGTRMALLDRPRVAAGTDPMVGMHWITPRWMSVAKVPLIRGRLFSRADRLGVQRVVLVNQTAARTLWPGQDPIGRAVATGDQLRDTSYVVGIVGDVRYESMEFVPRSDVYVSYYQAPLSSRMMLFLRTRGDPRVVASAARKALREVAPGFPMYEVKTMEDRIADVTAYSRFAALLLSLFAGLALALAVMGTYGVISFSVAQRTREIGVRVALGATSRQIMRLVLGQGVALATVGAACGLIAALMVTRVLRSMLYDVNPTDPSTLIVIVAVLVVAVLAASWIPARRAIGVPVVQALRGS